MQTVAKTKLKKLGIHNAVLPDFRDRLQDELKTRIQRNPNYSLRSFAAFLEISPSFLSKLLTGKRPVTPSTLEKLGAKLSFSKAELSLYKNAPSGSFDSALSPQFKQVAHDQFAVIADWYHYAILELAALPRFESSAKWIAKELGIGVADAQSALQRLVRLGFLTIDKNGRIRNSSGNNTTIGPGLATAANRNQQKQILDKAIDALENIPFEERSQTSMTLAIPRARLDEARQAIAHFRRSMMALLQDPESDLAPDSVYQLSISFYPLTVSSLERRPK